MKVLIQRVNGASVTVTDTCIARIDVGMLALIGIEKTDTQETASRLLQRLLNYRIFPDDAGRMNLDLLQSGGGLLLVPQFTLVADTAKGRRPGFSGVAEPKLAKSLFEYLVAIAEPAVASFGAGQFGADMQVALVNDGPVTFWLNVDP